MPKKMTTSSRLKTQAKVKEQGDAVIYTCSHHNHVMYKVRKGLSPACPVCDAEELLDRTKEAFRDTNEELARTRIELAKTTAQVSVLDAMRDAASELEGEDVIFLQGLAEMFRDDPDNVFVKQGLHAEQVTKSGVGTFRKDSVVGWDWRNSSTGERGFHRARSVGGMALAMQYSEALKLTGRKRAMYMLLKALSSSLENYE